MRIKKFLGFTSLGALILSLIVWVWPTSREDQFEMYAFEGLVAVTLFILSVVLFLSFLISIVVGRIKKKDKTPN